MEADISTELREVFQQAVLGAQRIFAVCLEVPVHGEVAMFFDDTTKDVAEAFRAAAKKLSLRLATRRIPLNDQFNFNETDELPGEVIDASAAACATIICLTDDPRGTGLRKRLLENGLRDADSRVAHMPGATLTLLSVAADIEYEEAARMCDFLGAVFSLGHEAILETYEYGAAPLTHDEKNKRHQLKMRLGGPERMPITSSGTIPPGTWGNVPGGETFIAPLENSAEGTFVLNGAFTDRVLTPGEQLILRFERGGLIEVLGAAEPRQAFIALFAQAVSKHDPYCHQLAELGIGVNRGIRKLSGKSLFDEKLYGTAHIAVGDNNRFGGLHSSSVHEDMVTLQPSLWVDGSTIMTQGRLVYDEDFWRDRLDSGVAGTTLPALNVADSFQIRPTIIGTAYENGKLRVNHRLGAIRNRRCAYTVGEERSSATLAAIHRLIPAPPKPVISLGELIAAAKGKGIESTVVRRALFIFARHHLVNVAAE